MISDSEFTRSHDGYDCRALSKDLGWEVEVRGLLKHGEEVSLMSTQIRMSKKQ